MTITHTNRKWATLAVGLLLVSGASLSARADDCDNCDAGRWQRFCSWCRGGSSGRGYGYGYGSGGRAYAAAYPGYYDQRDVQVYSAQGYNVPIAVPLAPCVQHTYNYGWGVPSSRLTRVGVHYNQWYPDVPFSQTGGYLPAGMNPPVYQPTDTTQLGYYHVHAPRWGRYGAY